MSFVLAVLLISPIAFDKELVLAAAENSIPTSYLENGEQTGILVDVINEAFRRTEHEIEIQLMPWARCLAETKNGTVDGVFSAFKTEERQSFLTYANEVVITQIQAFFVTADSDIKFDGDLAKLADYSIGIINKTSHGPKFDKALDDGIFKNIDVTQSSKSNVLKLLGGRVDIIPSYRHVVLSTAKQLGKDKDIKQLSPNLEAIPSYLAFSNKRDFTQVIIDFNEALASMKADGTYDLIFDKYLKSQ